MNRFLNLLRKVWINQKDPICLAPWVHAHMRINGERALCCNSSKINLPKNEPLNIFWNGRYLKSIRNKMLKGKIPAECVSCIKTVQSNKIFNTKFSAHKDNLLQNTSLTGKLSVEPISFDYRTSNLCNFKCRMCGPFSSSKAEAEEIEFNGEYSLEDWHRGSNKKILNNFHKEHSEKELFTSIEQNKIKDIYWAGGEPILLDFHWRAMQKILNHNLENNVSVSYNTNLSSLIYRDIHLFKDVLEKFPIFSIFASLDATGEIGEYIRTGFVWDIWLKNFHEAIKYTDQINKKIQIALCLTTPSIIDLKNILILSEKNSCEIRSISFSSCNDYTHPLSPLSLPKNNLKKLISEAIKECEPLRSSRNESVFHILDTYLDFKKSEPISITKKDKINSFKTFLQLEDRRKCSTSLKKILEKKDYLSEWYAEMVK